MSSWEENPTLNSKDLLLYRCGKTLSHKVSFKWLSLALFSSKVRLFLILGPELFDIPSSIGLSHSEWTNDNGKHYSIFFNVFVLLQVFNEINCRKLKSSELNVFANFFNNPLFIIILISTIVIQYFCVEYGGQSLRTVPLSIHEHLICLGLSSLPIVAGFFFKLALPTKLFEPLVKANEVH